MQMTVRESWISTGKWTNGQQTHFYHGDGHWGFCLWRRWMMKSSPFSLCHRLPHIHLSWANIVHMQAGGMTWTVRPCRTLLVSCRPFREDLLYAPAQWLHSFPLDELSPLNKPSCRKRVCDNSIIVKDILQLQLSDNTHCHSLTCPGTTASNSMYFNVMLTKRGSCN